MIFGAEGNEITIKIGEAFVKESVEFKLTEPEMIRLLLVSCLLTI